AFNVLEQMGNKAIPELEKVWTADPNLKMRARAFWMLVKITGKNSDHYIQQALKDPNPDLRMMGLRAAQEQKLNVTEDIRALSADGDVQVRSECALALHHSNSPDAASLWTGLAKQYDGKDRWYLEA